jgi:DNA (cytosine-5)-methyltransferase 1
MTIIIATTVAETKRGIRIWLEGAKLIRGQFTPAARYNMRFNKGSLTLSKDANGSHTVSSRKETPIIDLCSKKLAQWFSPGEKLKAIVRGGRIVIRRIAQTIKTNRREQRILAKIAAGKPLNVVTAFSGGGMMDASLHQGFKNAGIKLRTMLTYEIEGKYIDASLKANPELFDDKTVIVNAPIQDINISSSEGAEIFWAGIPCVGSSSAGRSKRKLTHAESHPDAGALFYSTLRLIEEFSPAIVILENVGSYKNTASFEVIRSMLSSTWGYTVHESILNGNDFGALENRDRLVVVAVSKNLQKLGGFDMSQITPVRQKEAKLRDILEPIGEDDPRWAIHEYLENKEISDIAAGKGFRRQLYTGDESKIAVITRGYSKIRSTDPHLMHPTKARYTRLLTPVEHARAKGVPEGWIQSTGLSTSKANEALGQGIIWPKFQAIGTAIGINLKTAAKHATIGTGGAEMPQQGFALAA